MSAENTTTEDPRECINCRASTADTEVPKESLDTELVYYSSCLTTIEPELTKASDKRCLLPWVRRLLGPGYNLDQFKIKRNKYMMGMTMMLLNHEVVEPFLLPPPPRALGQLDLKYPVLPKAQWERDSMWEETVQLLPDNLRKMTCSIHTSDDNTHCSPLDRITTTMVDQEFRFLLYLARPYAALLTNTQERILVASWLQSLCAIHGDACPVMKGIRNDYMQALLGCIHDLRVSGPFQDYPPMEGPLLPLVDAAKFAAKRHPVTDPTGELTEEMFRTEPVPDSGAFCYIVVSGDLTNISV